MNYYSLLCIKAYIFTFVLNRVVKSYNFSWIIISFHDPIGRLPLTFYPWDTYASRQEIVDGSCHQDRKTQEAIQTLSEVPTIP